MLDAFLDESSPHVILLYKILQSCIDKLDMTVAIWSQGISTPEATDSAFKINKPEFLSCLLLEPKNC